MTPNVTPIPIVSSSAAPPSSALTLSSRSTIGVIGSPRFTMDTPKLPCTAWLMKSQYCTSTGRSRPYSWSRSARTRAPDPLVDEGVTRERMDPEEHHE